MDLANADVTVDGDKVTVTATKDNKNYKGSKTVSAVVTDPTEKPGAPMISNVKVIGNKATVILSGDTEGAAGYDYVISTDRDCITNKNYDSISKNQVQTSTTFKLYSREPTTHTATLGNVTQTVRKSSATGLTHIHSLYPQSHRTLQLSQT